MKQFYLTGICAAVTLLAACNDDEKFDTAPQHEGILRATVESNNPSTRAGFTTTDATFYWSQGDQIGVMTTNSTTDFSLLNLEETSIGKVSGNFSGTITGNIQGYAVYPYNEYHKINSAELSYYLNSEYNYSSVDADFATETRGQGNSFNPPMWGQISNGGVGLKHLGGVFCIKLDKLPQGTDLKLMLTSDQKLNGTFTVDLSASDPVIQAVSAQNEEEKTVTIKFSNNEATSGVFYIPAPLGNHTLRLKVLDGTELKVDAALGTYTITRRLLKKLELKEGSVNAGEQAKAESASEVKTKLENADHVVLTAEVTNDTKIQIPEVSDKNKSKFVAFENVGGSSFTVKDAAESGTSSVKNLTLSFAKNESVQKEPSLTLETPNTTSTLQATAGDFVFAEVTASTAENTLVVDKGVQIKKLIVKKGNVRVNIGAKIDAIEKSSENTATVIVICEENANLPASLPDGFLKMPLADYQLQQTAKEGGTVDLAADVILSSPLVVEKDMTLNLNGHTMKPGSVELIKVLNTQDAVVLVRRGATLTIKGEGSITSKGNNKIVTTIKLTDSNDESDSEKKDQLAKLVVESGTIESDAYVISGNGLRHNTELVIKGGTITTAGDYAIYSPQNGTTTISGGIISGAAGAIALQNGRLEISGTAQLISEGTAAYVDEDGDGTRRLQNAAVCVPARYGACTVNISGGTFTAEGDAKVLDVTYNGAQTDKTKTISITGGSFTDLSPLAYLGSQADVNIGLNNDKSSGGFKTVEGQKVTVDLNRHTLTLVNPTVGSAGTETNSCQLLKGSEVTFKNGTLKSDNTKIVIQNYCKLLLENMIITAEKAKYVISNNNESCTINNSIINAGAGKVAFDVCSYSNYGKVIVTVKGNSQINGQVEFANDNGKNNGELIINGGLINGSLTVKNCNNPSIKIATGVTFGNSVTGWDSYKNTSSDKQ